ncbi:MAG: MFS transporter [Methanotrichaceae archaeon]|nr:MFS transporter [Methanotrichaceae archaeon]
MSSPERTGSNKRWISLLFICLSLLVISLNNNILNVALPSIAKDLHASSSQLQWIIDAYILIFAALLLTMGSVGDRYGRKKILLTGLILFAVGSALAGLSTSTDQLIAMRGFIGVAGAMIMPATLSILTATFPDNRERSQAIALWAATFGLGVGIGPLVGGWLLVHFPWNSIFYANLPVIAAALAGSVIYTQESKDESAPPADLPGVVLSIVGLLLLLFGIISAGVVGWTNSPVLLSLAASAVFLAAFVLWETRTRNPMLPMYLFRNPSFTGANLALTLIMFSLFGASFFLSQYFQIVLGYSALQAGLAMLPLALIVMVTSALSAKVSQRIGIKLTVSGSLLVVSIGLSYLAIESTPYTVYSTLLLGMAAIGVGLGTATGPATDSVMGAVPVSKAGVGSAMNDTTRELGGALGVAVLGSILNTKFLAELDQLTVLNLLPPEVYQTIKSGIEGAHQFATYIPFPEVQTRFLNYVDQAFIDGMKNALLVGAAIMILAAIITHKYLPDRIIRPAEDGSIPEWDEP